LRSCNSAFRSSSKLQDASLKMQTMLPGQSKVQLRLQNSCDDSIPTQCSALVATQGPVIPENSYDLQAHHGESSSSGRGRISNACPSCGFFSRERGDWVRWDDQLR
jgi:hypothetical protein